MTSAWDALGRALSPIEDRPRVAAGLESACYRTRSGAEYIVVHNPTTRTYIRLDPREFELLPLMDGQHSVKELVIAYYQRHGVLAMARLAGLVRLLREQRFLVEGSVDAYAALAASLRNRRVARTWGELDLKTSAFDLALGAAYRAWGHIFFHSAWLWIGVALGVVGPMLVVLELQRGRYSLYEIGGSTLLTVALLVVLALAALAIHELGHGLAVKHAGRRVNEAGVRLYFGLPAAFVDTTDIWMAPPRQRLLTAFAGPWTGLLVGGLFAIGATLVGSSPLGAFLFTAAFVFLVDNIFNFNPLLELDGYYMLIDFLDTPLLRARSLAFVRGPLWKRLLRREALSREERFFAGFGVGAILYGVTTALLALRAWQALLVPLVAASLQSDEPLRQVGGLVILAAVGVPLAFAAIALARRALRPLGAWLAWVSGRAAEHRHREALAALRAVPLWSEVPAGRLLEIARAMRAEDVATGHEVVRQGERGERFYLIARGAFEVQVDGTPQVRLGRGDYFGERALLHRAPRQATVIALEAGRLFVLEQSEFDTLLASDLAVRARLQQALAYRQAVADMPLFRDLSPGELDLLLSKFVAISAMAGEVIIRQGESGERFYVVQSGSVEVERQDHVLARLGPGEAFGEIALLLDVPRTASVTAAEPSTLLALDASDFRDLLASYLGRGGELERLSHLRLLSHKRLDEVV